MSAPEDRSVLVEAAKSHKHSPSLRLAYREALRLWDHPEWCSTEADYPGWVPPHTEPVYPDTSSRANFAASVAANLVTPPVWDDSPVCEPSFAPAPSVEDVQTGGVL